MNKPTHISFIGAGNMARSLIGGLHASADITLSATAPELTHLQGLAADFGTTISTDNTAFIAQADAVVLAVKPQVMRAVCEGIAANIQTHKPLIISVAAGIETRALQRWLGAELAVIRAMPNTPALLSKGATGLYANALVCTSQRQLSETLFKAVGVIEWVDDESLMHAVTALSGSGPAYFFMILEALETAAIASGMPAAAARTLAIQTMAGAAAMASSTGIEPAQLKRNVMSPGGTTERAIRHFENANLAGILGDGFRAALARSRELADLLGTDA